jgi:hypothetical protein
MSHSTRNDEGPFFGPRARIIGVDLNPAAKKWEAEGFEIKIGSQADPAFWNKTFAEIDQIDILLDDGGHTNQQQIITTCQALEYVRDGGLVVVEDTHCSYFAEFGNPYRFSFISFAKRMVDHLHTRNPNVAPLRHHFSETVASVRFFESIVAFEVDRRLCAVSTPTSNNGVSADARDFRYEGTVAARINALGRKLSCLSGVPVLWRANRLAPFLLGVIARIESHRLRRYFH